MNYLDAFILGIVEGVTEFLPVSSTGHLILTQSLLGIDGHAADVYTIVIQLGAILAVLALYKNRAAQMVMGLLGKDPVGLQLFLKLFVAFLPAVFFGLLFEDYIDQYLFAVVPVASALVVGGVVMIVVERFVTKPHQDNPQSPLRTVDDMTYVDALLIGLAQCLAMWPGTSRSMATIVGSQLRGFSSKDAAEISFLLALPTLGGATVYKLLKERETLMSDVGPALIVIGNLVAFVVAYFSVKWFVGVVTKYGMTPFGYYRIVIGILFLVLSLMGVVRLAG